LTLLILPVLNNLIKNQLITKSIDNKSDSVPFFSRPRSEGRPHHGRSFSISVAIFGLGETVVESLAIKVDRIVTLPQQQNEERRVIFVTDHEGNAIGRVRLRSVCPSVSIFHCGF